MTCAKRRIGESLAHYHARLKDDQKEVRRKLAGRFIWVSCRRLPNQEELAKGIGWPKDGRTYARALHGEIGGWR